MNLEKLKQSFDSDFRSQEAPNTPPVTQQELESLKQQLEEIESVSKDLTPDSALVLFHQWYLYFHRIFYDYSRTKFFSARNTKILFFSTSLSCRCTLEMCKNQFIDLLRFVNENNNHYDYWIVNTYEHPELAAKYHALFVPSVLIFNPTNEVLYKIEYDENMLAYLKDFFNNNFKGSLR